MVAEEWCTLAVCCDTLWPQADTTCNSILLFLPRKTDPVSLANSSPPPFEKILLHSWKERTAIKLDAQTSTKKCNLANYIFKTDIKGSGFVIVLSESMFSPNLPEFVWIWLWKHVWPWQQDLSRYRYFMSDLPNQWYDSLLTEQCGQTKPLMFSTMPRIRTPVFLQKVISLLTSPVDTAWSKHKTRNGNLHSMSGIWGSLDHYKLTLTLVINTGNMWWSSAVLTEWFWEGVFM